MRDPFRLLLSDYYPICDFVNVRFPTIGEIGDYIGEERYFSYIRSICSTPSQFKVALFDKGIDYSGLSDWEFFIMMCPEIFTEESKDITESVFGDFNLGEYYFDQHPETGDLILTNGTNVFTEVLYLLLTELLREVYEIEYVSDPPGNEHFKEYTIEKERRKMKRQKKQPFKSTLAPAVIALVNSSDFKYDYDSVLNLNVYRFYRSLKQIKRNKNYDHVMSGVYAGTIDDGKLNMQKIYWIEYPN